MPVRIIIFLLSALLIDISPGWTKTFTDDMGRKVELSESPTRIVSLAPSITEMLFYLDLGERVVGVTAFCNYPEEARRKPSIGFMINPDLEKIVSLQPDLVFATAEGNRRDVVDTLERVGIKVYVLAPYRLEDIFREILSIGEITGEGDRARERVKELKARVEAIRHKTEGVKGIKILYLISTDPIISVGKGSFIHDIIEIAGGENVAANLSTRYPRMQMEDIVVRDPEVILGPPDVIKEVGKWKRRWGKISAIKNDRIYSIDADIVNRPGPRVVEGVEVVYRYIHGDYRNPEKMQGHSKDPASK